MKYPAIPSNVSELSAAELRTLARAIKKVCKGEFSNPELSAEDATEAQRQLGIANNLIAAATLAEEEDAAAAEDAAAETAAEAAVVVVVVTDDEEDEGDTGTSASTPTEPTGRGGVALATTTGQVATALATPARTKLIDVLVASDGVAGKRVGEGFGSWGELAASINERAKSVNANTSEKFAVGLLKANYDTAHTLQDNYMLNLSKFEPEELTAALCAPATPYYDLHCMNATRRPVFNNLPQFAAPRGKVSIMPSPTLSQITTGYGVWTAANEASTNDTKSACQTITCGSPTEYQMYGVYRCMTVRNMLAMTYPELVEAWLNRLQAAQARLAEIQLLNAMGTASTSITAPLLGYGATTTIVSTLLNYLMLFQETQRWDISDNFELWGHRWILQALKMDLVRRRSTVNPQAVNIVSDEDINRMFRSAGFNPHWFIDNPSWAEAIPSLATASTLNRPPANVNFLVHAPGKFAAIDRGELRIGVTGNGIYRDNTSNSRNEFTYFFESFEGLVDTGNCGANIITIPVCWNGAQIDDLIINCQGGDEGGYQS